MSTTRRRPRVRVRSARPRRPARRRPSSGRATRRRARRRGRGRRRARRPGERLAQAAADAAGAAGHDRHAAVEPEASQFIDHRSIDRRWQLVVRRRPASWPPRSLCRVPPTPLVGRTVLREQVKAVLLERILAARVRAGRPAGGDAHRAELGVSQAPVREALRELEPCASSSPRRSSGAWVREVSDDELARSTRSAPRSRRSPPARRPSGSTATCRRSSRGPRDGQGQRRAEQVEHDARFQPDRRGVGQRAPVELWARCRSRRAR